MPTDRQSATTAGNASHNCERASCKQQAMHTCSAPLARPCPSMQHGSYRCRTQEHPKTHCMPHRTHSAAEVALLLALPALQTHTSAVPWPCYDTILAEPQIPLCQHCVNTHHPPCSPWQTTLVKPQLCSEHKLYSCTCTGSHGFMTDSQARRLTTHVVGPPAG